MKSVFSVIKGVHPGKFIERELNKRQLNQRQFAMNLGEHPQTLNAIIKGKRNLNIGLALKIEQKLALEEGFLMMLQVHYDIKKIKRNLLYHPNFLKLNKATFWDTEMDKIDWEKMKKTVILRVFSYGSKDEQAEIIRFYGMTEVESTLNRTLI